MLQPNHETPTISCQLLEAATDKQNCFLIHKHCQMHCTNSLTLRFQTAGSWSPANWKDVLRNHKHIWMQEMDGSVLQVLTDISALWHNGCASTKAENCCYWSFQIALTNCWTSTGKGERCNTALQPSAGKSPYSHSLFSCTILHSNAFLVCESKTPSTHIKEAAVPRSNSETSKTHVHYQCAASSLPLN